MQRIASVWHKAVYLTIKSELWVLMMVGLIHNTVFCIAVDRRQLFSEKNFGTQFKQHVVCRDAYRHQGHAGLREAISMCAVNVSNIFSVVYGLLVFTTGGNLKMSNGQ